MLLRSWLDGFTFAPSGAPADAAESDEVSTHDEPEATDDDAGDDEPAEDDAPEDEESEAGDDAGEVEDEPEAAAPQFSIADLGLGEDPDTARQTVAQLRQQAQRAAMLEQWYAFQQQQQQAELARQQAQQKPVEPEKPKLPWGNAPEFDPNWLSLLEKDEAGRFVAPSGVDPTLPQKVYQYQKWLQDSQQKFFTDPYSIVQQAIQPHLDKVLADRDQRLLQQMRQYNELEQLAQRYRSVIVDQNNQPTEDGVRFAQAAQFAIQHGVPNIGQYVEEQLTQPVLPYLAQENQRLKAELEALKKTPTPKVANDAAKRAVLQGPRVAPRNRDGTFRKSHRRSPPQNAMQRVRQGLEKAFADHQDGDVPEIR